MQVGTMSAAPLNLAQPRQTTKHPQNNKTHAHLLPHNQIHKTTTKAEIIQTIVSPQKQHHQAFTLSA